MIAESASPQMLDLAARSGYFQAFVSEPIDIDEFLAVVEAVLFSP